MRIAILSKTVCPPTQTVINYFIEKGIDISLVVIEKNFRKKFSKTEMLFQQAHDRFNRETKKYGPARRLARKAWDIMPVSVRKNVFMNIYEIPVLKKFSTRKFCEDKGIPVVEVQKHSSNETKQVFESYNIDYVLFVSSNWLLKSPIIDMETIKIINAHSGWLPKHKGLDSIGWSVLEKDPVGLTTHFIDAGVDSGDILKFFQVEIENGDTLNSISAKIGKLQPVAFLETLNAIEKGSIVPEKQTKEFIAHRPMTYEELVQVENMLKKQAYDQ